MPLKYPVATVSQALHSKYESPYLAASDVKHTSPSPYPSFGLCSSSHTPCSQCSLSARSSTGRSGLYSEPARANHPRPVVTRSLSKGMVMPLYR